MFGRAGDRPNVTNVVIIITDGLPNTELRNATLEAARDLQEIATMFAVGITDEIDEDVLRNLSSQPRILKQNYFTSANFSILVNNLEPLLDSFCRRGMVHQTEVTHTIVSFSQHIF